ncbi:MAG: exonuclease domain-containing protein [Corynebacterium sp.]|uniref:exonuclease domain-containing protein n=1 Tax=Corynebacterium sp. TaxID=1720 RepID=UPI0026DA8D79|nr:exonuclease domain-containing protein [Corynebacterium sp.]MDO5030851.1 exonuclease domain-containing protein [Corynebacterium sp.]
MAPTSPQNFFQSDDSAGEKPGYAVVDFETTGFTRNDRVIEIGVVLLDSQLMVEDHWCTLIQPNRGFDNSEIHGITPTDLVGAPAFEHVARRFADVLNGRVIVAHNAGFEYRFLANEFGRLSLELPEGNWLLDTMVFARHFLPGKPVSLAHVLEHFGIENEAEHTAYADAEATAKVFQRFATDHPDIVTYGSPLYFAPAQLAQLPISDIPLLPRNDHRLQGTPDNDAAENSATEAGNNPCEQDAKAQWLRILTRHAPGIGDKAADRYISYLAEAMVDGRLELRELANLHGIAADYGLSADDVNVLHEQYLQQLIVQAWSDGVITQHELSWLAHIAEELNIEPQRVEYLVSASKQLELHPGDRVTFTGTMVTPREVWESRARAVGLDVGGVTKKSVVLVAADINTQSNKAKRARALGVPIVDEVTFAQALANLSAEQAFGMSEADKTPQSSADAGSTAASDEDDKNQPEGPDLTQIFPWLSDENLRSELGDSLSGIRDDVVGIARAWIDGHQTSGLDSLSPYMNFLVFPESTEWQRVLNRLGLKRPAVKDTTVRDLQDLKGYGRVRVQKLVADAVMHAFDEFEVGDTTTSTTDDPFEATDHSAIVWDDTTEPDQSALLDWLAITGTVEQLQSEVDVTVPKSVREQLVAANNRVPELLDAAEREIHSIANQDERFAAILNRRLIGGERLETLGQQFGVSRERVRQLESKLLEALSDAGPNCELLRTGLFHRYAPLTRIDILREDLPGLFETPTGMSAPLIELINLTGTVDAEATSAQWSIEDGWFIEAGFDNKFAAAIASLADEFGIVPLPTLVDTLGIPASPVIDWVQQRTSYKIFEGDLFTKRTSVSDRAVALLAHRGAPMHIDEIAEIIADRNSRAIDGRLSVDPRTMRCAPGTWALTVWQLEEWTTISDYIARRIDEATARGEIGAVLDDVVAGATAIGVSESSVRTFASGGEFVLEDGYVRRRTEEELEPVDATPEESRGLYLRDGKWCLLLTITRDHVRGSGSAIPAGIAGMYGLSFGEEKLLPSRLGEQRIAVGRTNTTMSTISRFVADLQLTEGDRVWVHFGDRFDITRAPGVDSAATGLAALVNAFGLDEKFAASQELEQEQVLSAINEALGLSPDAARRKTVARLRHRRDDELADTIQAL